MAKFWFERDVLKVLNRIAIALEGQVDSKILERLKKLEAMLDNPSQPGKGDLIMSANSDSVLAEIDAIIVKVQALQKSQSGMTAAEKADIDAKLAVLSQFADPTVPNPQP